MVSNLTVDEVHDFISKDFTGAWDSIASNDSKDIGRGSFMFARQAMNLLEFACRLYGRDSKMRTQFSTELKNIEPKYFTRLPSPCADPKEFTLPHLRNKSGDLLLWALFDLVRNGLAHQYQQIIVVLKNRKKLFIELTGAKEKRYLDIVRKSRHSNHLDYYIDEDGDIGIKVYPDQLFLDIEQAIQQSQLLSKKHRFNYLRRPIGKKRRKAKNKAGKKFYDFNVRCLERSLANGGHSKI
jgi:hypothetical protein